MNLHKIILAIMVILFLAGCENMASYKGIIVDNQNDSCLKGVKILVIMNNKIQDQYGTIILDTISSFKRDSLRRLKIKDNYSGTITNGKYFKNEPFKSDSLGRFFIFLHEGCLFGCPSYNLKFEKEGYLALEVKGDWKSNDNLVIRLKKN
jgi:hypothetical protein